MFKNSLLFVYSLKFLKMPYSLRNRKTKDSTSVKSDKNLEKKPSEKSKIVKAKLIPKAIHPSWVRPSLPITDAKERVLKEIATLKGTPSQVKEKLKHKKPKIFHKIDFAASGKIQKSSQLQGQALGKIVLKQVQKLDPGITPSIVKARSKVSSAILSVKTEILKTALLKEIKGRRGPDKKQIGTSDVKSPKKSPLKGS